MRLHLRGQHEVRDAERPVGVRVPQKGHRAEQKENARKQRCDAGGPASHRPQHAAAPAVQKAEQARRERGQERRPAVEDRQRAAVRHEARFVIKKEKHLDAAQHRAEQDAGARNPERAFCFHFSSSPFLGHSPQPFLRQIHYSISGGARKHPAEIFLKIQI